MGERVACVGLVVGLCVVLCSCGGYDTSPKNMGRCKTNLKLMHKALKCFCEMDSKPAVHLGEIFPRPFDDRARFRCPSSSDDPTKYSEGEVLKPHHCSYIYNPLGMFTELDDDLQGKLILVYEKADYHGPGRNVIFCDGTLEFLKKQQFEEAQAFTEQWMKENL